MKPITEFSGVLSSWLMFARKSLLALFAASASSLAIARASWARTRSVTSLPKKTAPEAPSRDWIGFAYSSK